MAEYREELAELEALGVGGAVALMREHAAAERPEKASRYRGVYKLKGGTAKPWAAKIGVTEDGKPRLIHIGTFARERPPLPSACGGAQGQDGEVRPLIRDGVRDQKA